VTDLAYVDVRSVLAKVADLERELVLVTVWPQAKGAGVRATKGDEASLPVEKALARRPPRDDDSEIVRVPPAREAHAFDKRVGRTLHTAQRRRLTDDSCRCVRE
jgi:hypothetical protein